MYVTSRRYAPLTLTRQNLTGYNSPDPAAELCMTCDSYDAVPSDSHCLFSLRNFVRFLICHLYMCRVFELLRCLVWT